MDEYYKYSRKTKQTDSAKTDFVRQMLDKERDEKFTLRLPKKLKDKLKQENKPANIIIELLANRFYEPEYDYDEEAWAEEIQNF